MFNFILPTFYFKVERWKWNSDYRVYVSNRGKFKDEHKKNLPIRINQKGYCSVYTSCGCKLAHRIVMLTWKPIPDAENLTIDHLNHNKRDNSVENLEWVTVEENQRRADEDIVYVNNLEEELNTKCYYKGKSFKFLTLDDAIDWCMKQNKTSSDRTAIKKKIMNSIKYGSTYYGSKWECR